MLSKTRLQYSVPARAASVRPTGGRETTVWSPYILAEEKDLIALPDDLTCKDGAHMACDFGTVYEAIEKIGVDSLIKGRVFLWEGASGWKDLWDLNGTIT